MITLTLLKNIGKAIWNNRTIIMLAIIIILIILFIRQCGQSSYLEQKNKQNAAAMESLNVYKQKNGDLMAERAIFVANKNDLSQVNAQLKSNIDALQKEKSKVEYITLTKVQYVDTGSVKNKLTQLVEHKYALTFDYRDPDSILTIKGNSSFWIFPSYNDTIKKINLDIHPGITSFDTVSVKFGLVLGMKKDKDGVERAFAKPNPYSDKIQIASLDAVELENYYKKKYQGSKAKHYSVGPYIGAGVGIGTNGNFTIRPSVGISVQYSLFKF